MDRNARCWMRLAPILAAPLLLGTTPPPTAIEIEIENLRSRDGMLRICLTRAVEHFPDCSGDPAALKRSVPAASPRLTLSVVPGRYAMAVVHDENGNGKLDKTIGIPREGFGFSRNPKIRFGPPKFAEVVFDIEPGVTARQVVRVRYLL